jgi:hypothetical protein
MSNQQTPQYPLLSFADLFRLSDDFWYKFVYFPTTNWQRAFNPQFFFGSNIEDTEIEQHVLNQVGSYGLQLGRIIDMLDVLAARIPETELTSRERVIMERFRSLSYDVDHAVANYRGEDLARQGITRRDINDMISELRDLERSNPSIYRQYVQQLRDALALDGNNLDGNAPITIPNGKEAT